ncbi:MAG: hypothetical protein AAF517_24490 [Planctomycetota bacterium]
MRILLVTLAPVLLSSCALGYSVGDLSKVPEGERTREVIASPVYVEFDARSYDSETSFGQLLFITKRWRGDDATRRGYRLEAAEYLAALGVFGSPQNKIEVDERRMGRGRSFDDAPVLFGSSEDFADEMRVRLTLLMDRSGRPPGVFGLVLSVIPTWETLRCDLLVDAWDPSGKRLLRKKYDERYRRITWLPFVVTWPFQGFFSSHRARVQRQLDHFLVDLREVLATGRPIDPSAPNKPSKGPPPRG